MTRVTEVTDGTTAYASQYNAIVDDYSRRLQVPASYVIYQENGSYYGENCLESGNDYEEYTDIVALVNSCLQSISDSGNIFVKAGNYTGTGLIEKPAGKSIGIIGEIYDQASPSAVSITCKGIDATQGVETHLILENIVFACNADVDAFINCTTVIPQLKNIQIRCESKAKTGFSIQPTANGKAAVVDSVDIFKPKAYAAYIKSDWFNCPTWISTYSAIEDASDNDCVFWIAGGYGVTINKLHLYTPTNNPNYGLRTSAETVINFLDFEGVTCNTALIHQGGALTVGHIRVGSAPDMLAGDWHAQYMCVNSYAGRRLEDMIDLTNPAAWTAASHGSDISAYVYVPNGTVLASGNTTYYLYNKWCQFYNWGGSPVGLSSTKTTLTPITTLPVGLYAYAYDNDYGANHRIAIVFQNNTGGNITLGSDIIFFLKLC